MLLYEGRQRDRDPGLGPNVDLETQPLLTCHKGEQPDLVCQAQLVGRLDEVSDVIGNCVRPCATRRAGGEGIHSAKDATLVGSRLGGRLR